MIRKFFSGTFGLTDCDISYFMGVFASCAVTWMFSTLKKADIKRRTASTIGRKDEIARDFVNKYYKEELKNEQR